MHMSGVFNAQFHLTTTGSKFLRLQQLNSATGVDPKLLSFQVCRHSHSLQHDVTCIGATTIPFVHALAINVTMLPIDCDNQASSIHLAMSVNSNTTTTYVETPKRKQTVSNSTMLLVGAYLH